MDRRRAKDRLGGAGAAFSAAALLGTSLRAAARVGVALLTTALVGVSLLSGCSGDLEGSAGLGDSYYPKQGNGGYDALSYEIVLDIDPETGAIAGETAVEGRATQDLESFNLDLAGLDIAAVEVNGEPADHDRKGDELVVRPAQMLQTGQSFSTRVWYSGIPETQRDPNGPPLGWHHESGAIYTLGEPKGAHTWFPVNDHPRDKATYVFRLTVPSPYVAVANGTLVETATEGMDQTFVWEMRQPMASYLAAVTVDRFEVEESTARDGLTIRNYFEPDSAASADLVFATTSAILQFYEQELGPYPFEVYGVVVPGAPTSLAMENQTLSLFGSDMVEALAVDPTRSALYVAHELAHQWYGNSVTLSDWSDIWLNEGFATFASWLWIEHAQGPEALAATVDQSYDELNHNRHVPPGDPGPDDLFHQSVYERGALTLHALRLLVGDDSFGRILRTWSERYRYGNVTTADFVALAEELSGTDLDAFFSEWLYENGRLPELPPTTTVSVAGQSHGSVGFSTDLRDTPVIVGTKCDMQWAASGVDEAALSCRSWSREDQEE